MPEIDLAVLPRMHLKKEAQDQREITERSLSAQSPVKKRHQVKNPKIMRLVEEQRQPAQKKGLRHVLMQKLLPLIRKTSQMTTTATSNSVNQKRNSRKLETIFDSIKQVQVVKEILSDPLTKYIHDASELLKQGDLKFEKAQLDYERKSKSIWYKNCLCIGKKLIKPDRFAETIRGKQPKNIRKHRSVSAFKLEN